MILYSVFEHHSILFVKGRVLLLKELNQICYINHSNYLSKMINFLNKWQKQVVNAIIFDIIRFCNANKLDISY